MGCKSRHTVRRALNLLKIWFEGSHEESYGMLLDYVEEIKLRNSWSICSCITQCSNGELLLKRTFISFKTTVDGFLKGCRPLIGVDGCFLKGPYKGVLLVALGLDGNNGYFPIAYAIVQQENKSNWLYFFKALRKCFENNDMSKFTFITARHKVKLNYSNLCLSDFLLFFFTLTVFNKYRHYIL